MPSRISSSPITSQPPPINPEQETDKDRQTNWAQLVGGIDLSQKYAAVRSHHATDSDGKPVWVEAWRDENPDPQQVVWTKLVPATHPQLGALKAYEDGNVRAIQKLTVGKDNLSGLVAEPVLIKSEIKPHAENVADPDRQRQNSNLTRQSKNATLQVTTQTKHAGASLDRLIYAGACQNQQTLKVYRHVLEPPLNLLRFLLRVLKIFDAWAAKSITHCDVYANNIACPTQSTKWINHPEGDAYDVTIDWHHAAVLDYGMCIQPLVAPPVPLPFASTEERYSMRLRSLAKKCENWEKEELARRQIKSWDNDNRAQLWNNNVSLLKEFQNIDWREDLYQLGYSLQALLRQLGMRHVESGKLHTQSVNDFLWGIPGETTAFIPSMLNWGVADLPKNQHCPHTEWMEKIQTLIDQLDPELDGCNTFVFKRVDSDPIYRAQLALDNEQRAFNLGAVQAQFAQFQQDHGSVAVVKEAIARDQADLVQREAALAGNLQALQVEQAAHQRAAEGLTYREKNQTARFHQIEEQQSALTAQQTVLTKDEARFKKLQAVHDKQVAEVKVQLENIKQSEEALKTKETVADNSVKFAKSEVAALYKTKKTLEGEITTLEGQRDTVIKPQISALLGEQTTLRSTLKTLRDLVNVDRAELANLATLKKTRLPTTAVASIAAFSVAVGVAAGALGIANRTALEATWHGAVQRFQKVRVVEGDSPYPCTGLAQDAAAPLLKQLQDNSAALHEWHIHGCTSQADAQIGIIEKLFDKAIMRRSNGKFNASIEPPASTTRNEFATVLAQHEKAAPGLALRLGILLACQPNADKAAGIATLRQLVASTPRSEEAGDAQKLLTDWAAGNFARCNQLMP